MSLLYRFSLVLLLALAPLAQAQDSQAPLSPANAHFVEMLTNGGAVTIRDAAKGMHRTGVTDERVLDVAAQVLLRDYKTANDGTSVDALAWITHALSNAKTNRYQSVLKEVEENAAHRKLAGYAEKNQNRRLPEAAQYQSGSVNLTEVAEATAEPSTAPAAQAQNQSQTQAQTQAANGQHHPISAVTVGMSRQQAMDMAGSPTSTYHHQTGKAWNPFNFKGGDMVRENALYKGQGRIVFANSSRYTSSMEVIEVILDEGEDGYQ